jgi:hypothetical protein
MPHFKVLPYCEYRIMVEGTTTCRKVFPEGSVIELENINVGDQACRLEELTEEQVKAHIEEVAAKKKAKKSAIEKQQQEEQEEQKEPTLLDENTSDVDLNKAKEKLRGKV